MGLEHEHGDAGAASITAWNGGVRRLSPEFVTGSPVGYIARMIGRRVAAFLACLVLLHLQVAAVLRDCEKQSAQEHSASHQHAAREQHDENQTPGDSDSCESPISLECCRAMGACILALTLDTTAKPDRPFLGSGKFAPPSVVAPTSRNIIPEPPPPRA